MAKLNEGQKVILKKMGVTPAYMQQEWDRAKTVNQIIKNLSENGLNWTDLAPWQLEELPGLKERTEEILREEKENKEKEEYNRTYYWEHFDEIMLKKIDSGEKLTERELQTLAFDFECDRMNGENRRWSRSVTTIIELNGRFFAVDWEEGLTECQEDEFHYQPREVIKHEYEKVITVTEWLEKK